MQTLSGSATLLAALWVALGQSLGESLRPGCDNGKVLLDTDLPKDAAHWECPTPLWTTSQRLHSVDTVYDSEPAKLTCMDQHITFNHTIPNSGAFRPVRAESGEYLFCPPQRWLNNLHHGATVLLYHPCSPLHERLRLSTLAQSCISDYILTPHKNLDRNRPIALVSWGRTLEMSTVASLEICSWLDTTSSTKANAAEMAHKHKYNLLLTRSAKQDKHKENKGSLKQCCEQTLSSLTEDLKKTRQHSGFRTGDLRQIQVREKRAAIKSNTSLPKISVHPTSKVTHKLQNDTLPEPIPSQRTADQSIAKDALLVSVNLKENPISKKTMSNNSQTTVQKQTSSSNKMEKNPNNALKPVAKHRSGSSKDHEVITVEEREADSKNNDVRSQQNDSLPNPHPVGDIPSKNGVCKCKADLPCECSEGGTGEQSRGFQRTPRTDEAVWAVGALGFLLVLLTLSILHTRLYKHWRRGTSLYWHDPRQDYDSVADVIRRRLRSAKKRRKRSRKKECVLLPSSSSSEEYP